MTQEERGKLASIIDRTAQYYGRKIEREVISMMIDDLSSLSFFDATKAYEVYRKDPKNRTMPLPAQIIGAANPASDPKLLATEIARKVDRACIKHGSYWGHGIIGAEGFYFEDDKGNRFKTFKEAVISELGPIGWHAICSRGGWEQMAQSANEMDEGQFIAQLRDQCEGAIQLQKQGHDFTALELPKTMPLPAQIIGAANPASDPKLQKKKAITK